MIWLKLIPWLIQYAGSVDAARLPPSVAPEPNDTTALGHLPPVMDSNEGTITNVSFPSDPSHHRLHGYLYVFSKYQPPLFSSDDFQRSITFCRVELTQTMHDWKKKFPDKYPSRRFDCIQPAPNNFRLILNTEAAWSMTFALLSQALGDISEAAREFGGHVPAFNFDILSRPFMELLAKGTWDAMRRESSSITGRSLLPNSSVSVQPPDPFVVERSSLVYVFSDYTPPLQAAFSLATTAMFCEYIIVDHQEKAHAAVWDQYSDREFYCTDDDTIDSIALKHNPNFAGWTMTYGDILSVLEDLTVLVKAFNNQLPYFNFEIHAKLGKLRPVVAIGSWARARSVASVTGIAS